LDFVVWGHEHDSHPDPVNNRDTGCDITQPGSSVATSLSEGEALKAKLEARNQK
jgi:double-strand break repair protein MRE11